MPAWLAPFERLADRSPIAVRQLRQQLRGKTWTISLIAIPALCLLGALLCFAMEGRDLPWMDTTIPRMLFGGYLLLWAAICGAFQPGSAGRALRREREDQTWDLIELAGLGGYHIALGFWYAALVQIILMSALFAPFLVMAWLLRGVDTEVLLIALICVPAWGALMAAMNIFFASTPLPKKKKAGHIQVGGEALALLLGIPFFTWLISANGAASFLPGLSNVIMTVGIAVSVWLLALSGCLVHAGTALSHPALNRSTGPRLIACIAALLIAVWGALFAPFTGLSTAAVLIIAISIWCGLTAIAEFDGTTPRQQRWINEARGFWQHTSWFLGPGCRRGRRCVLLIAALGLGCALASGNERTMAGCMGMVAFAMTFFVLGDWVARHLLGKNFVHRPRVQTVTTVMITGAIHIIGWLITLFIGAQSDSNSIMFLIPIAAIMTMFSRGDSSSLAMMIAIMGLISVAILIIQACGRERGTVRLVGDDQGDR
jgi:hypothetical protein